MPGTPNTNLATRRAYAEILRHFLAGRLITDDYEDAHFKLIRQLGHDNAADDIFTACWHLYDDITPHRMSGDHRVQGELRRLVARWIVFLRSGAAYDGHFLRPEHPRAAEARRVERAVRVQIQLFLAAALLKGLGLVGLMTGTGSLGTVLGVLSLACGVGMFILGRRYGLSLNPSICARAFGDPEDPWPFRAVSDLKSALARPTYLFGR